MAGEVGALGPLCRGAAPIARAGHHPSRVAKSGPVGFAELIELSTA